MDPRKVYTVKYKPIVTAIRNIQRSVELHEDNLVSFLFTTTLYFVSNDVSAKCANYATNFSGASEYNMLGLT
jgi:hypothetical protein